MSNEPESPATPGRDTPAGRVPDDATAVHPTGGEPTGAEPVPAAAPAKDPAGVPAWTPPAPPRESSGKAAVAVATDRPEVAVGAAFAGGLVLALILKRLAR